MPPISYHLQLRTHVRLCPSLTTTLQEAMIAEMYEKLGFSEVPADPQVIKQHAMGIRKPAFPSTAQMAQVASVAYKKNPDKEIHWRSTPEGHPDNFKLLTYIYNSADGYFGVAYWNPRDQQIIIGHRGTDPKEYKDWWVDIVGVWLGFLVGRIESAITFTYKILKLIKELNRKPGICVQLSITGHSLGGWLAHISTFSAKYLTLSAGYFRCIPADDFTSSYHAHSVTFDNPGCKAMLTKLQSKLFDRMGHKSLYEDLDITSYLSKQNIVNTVHYHIGTVYQVDVDMSEKRFFDNHTLFCHNLDFIIRKLKSCDIEEVVDWPKWGLEYLRSFTLRVRNRFGYNNIRYLLRNISPNLFQMNVLTQAERNFVFFYKTAIAFQVDINVLVGVENLQFNEWANTLFNGDNFKVENEKYLCESADRFLEAVSMVRRVCHFYPRLRIMADVDNAEIIRNIYDSAFDNYSAGFEQFDLLFEPKPYFTDFWTSDTFKVLRQIESETKAGVLKSYKMLGRQFTNYQRKIISLEKFMLLNDFANFNMYLQNASNLAFVVECKHSSQFSIQQINAFLTNLFGLFEQNFGNKIKINLVIDSQLVGLQLPPDLITEVPDSETGIKYSRLLLESKDIILSKSIIFQGNAVQIFEEIAELLTTNDLMKLGFNEEVCVGGEGVLFGENITYVGRTLVTNPGIGSREFREFNADDKFVSRQNVEENGPMNVDSPAVDIDQIGSFGFDVREFNNIEKKLIFVTGKAGMGKTTLFTRLMNKLGSGANLWPLRTTASDLIAHFNGNADVTAHLIDALQINSDLEKVLFNHYLENGKIVIFVDDLDRLDPFKKDEVQMFFDRLLGTNIKQIWVSCQSRCALRLLQFPQEVARTYTLQVLTEDEQKAIVGNIWKNECYDFQPERYEIFFGHLMALYWKIFGNKMKNLTGNPKILELYANFYKLDFMKYNYTAEFEDETVSKNKIWKFYNQIVDCDLVSAGLDQVPNRLPLEAVKHLLPSIYLDIELKPLLNVRLNKTWLFDAFKSVHSPQQPNSHFLCNSFAEFFTAIYFINHIKDVVKPPLVAAQPSQDPNSGHHSGDDQERQLEAMGKQLSLCREKWLHLALFKNYATENNAVISNFLASKLLEEEFTGVFEKYMNKMRQFKDLASINSSQLFVMTQLAHNYTYVC